MFEEVCLVCGLHLADEGRAYCSDECENTDNTSPSLSSASSALASPQLDYTYGGDVPPLLPSALGFALYKVSQQPQSQSLSSSSASSTSWSVLTDEEGVVPLPAIGCEHSYPDYADFAIETHLKLPGQSPFARQHPLLYTRRPSGMNNRSTIPQLHKRSASGSCGHTHCSASGSASSTEDETCSEFSCSSRDEIEQDQDDQASETSSAKAASKFRQPRNRASLPACFSLLKMGSIAEPHVSPVSTITSKSISRESPPTPTLLFSGLLGGLSPDAVTQANVQFTPRGRQRFADNSRSSRTGADSRSPPRGRNYLSRTRFDYSGQIMDWSSIPGPTRGRAPRRNSSPPPKMVFSGIPIDSTAGASSRAAAEKERGHFRVDESHEIGYPTQSPGYSHGRSGLLDQERHSRHSHSSRVR